MRKIKNFKEVSNVTLCAVIVKSQRQNGKVKQKFLKYLGSIHEDKIDSANCRDIFWRNVSEKLNTLELNQKNKASIINKLRQVVPMSNHRNSISPPKF